MEYYIESRLLLTLIAMATAVQLASSVSDSGAGAVLPSPPGTPVFSVQPEPIYYVVKGRPVTLMCRAAPAVQISVKCAGQWISPQQQVNTEVTDPQTGVKFLQTAVDVTKEQVEEQLSEDGYWCECHAWNNVPNSQPLPARSTKAQLIVAYLRKRFEQEPINTVIETSSTTQLQCLPPTGLPAPQVFWLKDGEVVDVQKEINFIISNEGSLIINQARLTDSGNYTCGAQNIAARRLSESATLTVFVNGGWSAWTDWSECSTRCVKGVQRRSRTCSHPAPVNGGAPCQGDTVQRVPCIIQCPVDGEWSTWSSWSTCSPDCKHHRRRLCDSPAPENGGRHCDGTDLNTSNCTGGHCRDGYSGSRVNFVDDGQALMSASRDSSTAMYAGLAVAVVVFVAVTVVIICLLRRHKAQLLTGLSDKPSLNLGHVSELAMAPDLTKSVVVTVPADRSPSASPNSSVSDRARDSIISTQRLLPYTCTDPQHHTAGATSRRPPALLPTDVTTARPAPPLPSNVETDALVWSTVTPAGGRITLPDSGVSMTIPEGAVRPGQTVDIYLAVSRDDKDRPKLTDVQTLLSAVIMCGPPTVRLDKPVVLSFPHCASVKHGQWNLSLFTTHSADDEQPAWKPMCNLGRETINTTVYVQMDSSQCHVMTDTMARYTLTGEPRTPTARAVKILRLAVFAPQVPLAVDYNLRVYFVEDTQDALEGVMQVERRLGGCLLDKPRQLLFQFNAGANLCVSIDEFGPGWRCKQAANYQEIPFRHIWNGTQNGLHCSFALEHVDRTENQLTCNIVVCQTELPVNTQVLRISHNISQGLQSSVSQYALYSELEPQSSTVNESGFVNLDQPNKVFRLPVHVKRKLSDVLDPPNSRGNDWRMLAQRLSVDRYINYFATKMSPTEHILILDLWEARHREDSAITDLMNSLRVMGRMDAAGMIEKELGIASWL